MIDKIEIIEKGNFKEVMRKYVRGWKVCMEDKIFIKFCTCVYKVGILEFYYVRDY